MNLKATVVAGACFIILLYAHGYYQYRSGWNEGRANLASRQQQKAQAELAKKTQRQQQDESKAAAAEESRKMNTEVITRDVIKYIKTRDHSDCEFPAERVRIKSAAADNAACLPGFDDCSVRTGKSK